MKPTINKIGVFDATKNYIVEFAYQGNQPYRNDIYIYNAATAQLIFSESVESMKCEHIIPANKLKNNVQYYVQVCTYDVNGQCSDISDALYFYCYSTPQLSLNNLNSDGSTIINASNYDVQVAYSQKEGRSLREYIYYLYDANKTQIYVSGTKYYDVVSNTSNGLAPKLSGNTNTFLRGDGTYAVPPTTSVFKADNSTAGIMKLYDSLGSATDGSVTQAVVNTLKNDINSAYCKKENVDGIFSTISTNPIQNKVVSSFLYGGKITTAMDWNVLPDGFHVVDGGAQYPWSADKHAPVGAWGWGFLFSWLRDLSGYQIYITASSRKMYIRSRYGSNWTGWGEYDNIDTVLDDAINVYSCTSANPYITKSDGYLTAAINGYAGQFLRMRIEDKNGNGVDEIMFSDGVSGYANFRNIYVPRGMRIYKAAEQLVTGSASVAVFRPFNRT